MPQDRSSGSAGNLYGRECGKRIAAALGAERIRTDGNSNECLLGGMRIVIKCSRAATQQQVGVYLSMLERLDAVVGAFENENRSTDIVRLSAKDYAECMRVRSYVSGDLGLVHRRSFAEKGILLTALPPVQAPADSATPCNNPSPVLPADEEQQGNRIREILPL